MAGKRPMYALCVWSVHRGAWAVMVSSADLGKVELFGGHLARVGSFQRIEACSSSVDDLDGVRVFPLPRPS